MNDEVRMRSAMGVRRSTLRAEFAVSFDSLSRFDASLGSRMIDAELATTSIVSLRTETDPGRRRDCALARIGRTFGRGRLVSRDRRCIAGRDRRRRYRPAFPQHGRIDSRHQQHRDFEAVSKLLAEKKARVLNIDATIIAEEPKIAPHVSAMRKNIATAIDVANPM